MTRIKNILVPVDFSDASRHGLRYACEVADTSEASLHVLHALENPYPPGGRIRSTDAVGFFLKGRRHHVVSGEVEGPITRT